MHGLEKIFDEVNIFFAFVKINYQILVQFLRQCDEISYVRTISRS